MDRLNMDRLAARSMTPQSPSSLTPSIDSATPPPMDHRYQRSPDLYRHRVIVSANGHSVESRQSTPPDDSSSTDSDTGRREPNLLLHFPEDMTLAQVEDPYRQHRPSPNAAPFIPSTASLTTDGSGPIQYMGNGHHSHHLHTPTHAMHSTPRGSSGYSRTRSSLSPASVNHHDAHHPRYGYNASPQNGAPSPTGPHGHHHQQQLGLPPSAGHHYQYGDPELSNIEAQMMHLSGGSLPTPRHIEYPSAGGLLHLQTPRHMRPSNGQMMNCGDPLEKRTFYALRLLEKVQYCAYKLDHLQEKYREEYVRQQELWNNVQQMRAISPRNSRIPQMNAFCAASRENIKRLLISVSQYHSQMQQYLAQRIPLRLSPDEETIFAKFQSYFDRFEQTQMHLVHAGIQHYQQASLSGPGGPVPNGVPSGVHSHGRNGAISNHVYSDGGGSRGGKSSLRSREAGDPNTLQATNSYPQQIPEFGYVVIGTRMSQMISLIVPAMPETEQQCELIREYMEHLVRSIPEFRAVKIVAYGSSTNDLFIKGSDLNFCVKMKPLGCSVEDAQAKICDVLRNENFDCVRPIRRVNGEAGISFLHPQTELQCQVSFNTMKEIGSSRLIRAYATIDSRFKHIAQVVKHWSLRRNVCVSLASRVAGIDPVDSGNGRSKPCMSPYTLVLMVINFLQQRRPPVLPILSIMVESETGSSPWSDKDDFQINTQKFREFAAKNEESAAQLLVAFFRFYAHEFDTHNLVVSVRTGSFLTKTEKKWDDPDHSHLLSVEDPFDSSFDLGEGIERSTVHFIVSEFMRACRVLCETYKIYEVCKSYHSEKDIMSQSDENDAALAGSPASGPSTVDIDVISAVSRMAF